MIHKVMTIWVNPDLSFFVSYAFDNCEPTIVNSDDRGLPDQTFIYTIKKPYYFAYSPRIAHDNSTFMIYIFFDFSRTHIISFVRSKPRLR